MRTDTAKVISSALAALFVPVRHQRGGIHLSSAHTTAFAAVCDNDISAPAGCDGDISAPAGRDAFCTTGWIGFDSQPRSNDFELVGLDEGDSEWA